MAGRRSKTKVDPVLRRELQETESQGSIEAVLRLRAEGKALVPPPEKTRGLAEEVVRRVAGELGFAAQSYDFNVFPNLGYFVLSGPPRLVEKVVAQPEIASASANRRSS